MAASNTFTFKNARMVVRNFSGKEDRFSNTDRTFLLLLPEDSVQDMINEGFRVKYLQPRDEEEEPTPFIRVKVKFGYRPPKITMISGGVRTLLTEQTVGSLDFAQIERADLSIRAYHGRTKAGMEFCTAYLDKLFVTIQQDELDAMYAEASPIDEEEPPEEWRG